MSNNIERSEVICIIGTLLIFASFVLGIAAGIGADTVADNYLYHHVDTPSIIHMTCIMVGLIAWSLLFGLGFHLRSEHQ